MSSEYQSQNYNPKMMFHSHYELLTCKKRYNERPGQKLMLIAENYVVFHPNFGSQLAVMQV
jgi:hypothetical protein